MKYVRRLMFIQDLRDALAVPEITLLKTHIRKLSRSGRALVKICTNHLPAVRGQKNDQVRANEALCTGY
jgi:hypothetical protein